MRRDLGNYSAGLRTFADGGVPTRSTSRWTNWDRAVMPAKLSGNI